MYASGKTYPKMVIGTHGRATEPVSVGDLFVDDTHSEIKASYLPVWARGDRPNSSNERAVQTHTQHARAKRRPGVVEPLLLCIVSIHFIYSYITKVYFVLIKDLI